MYDVFIYPHQSHIETHQLAPPSGEPPQLPEFAARVLENANQCSE